jgi:hypothetical protein
MNTNFRRLFLPMAALLLLAIIFLGITYHAFLYDYIVTNNEDTLCTNAEAVADLSVAYYSTGSLRYNMNFWMELSFSARLSGAQTLICDENGTVILCSEDIQGCSHIGLHRKHLCGKGVRQRQGRIDLHAARFVR